MGLPEPAATVEAALQESFVAADVVFTGEVLAVERAEGAVTVRWRVEDAIRGVSPGEYVLREWPGLWAGDTARYTVGERALVLLHAPLRGGFASPVGGLDGVIRLRGDAAGSVLDLRWLAQHVGVTDAARLRPLVALQAAGSLEVADALMAQSVINVRQVSDPARDAGTVRLDRAAGAVSYAEVDGSVVLGMLHAWQRASGGAH